MSRTLVPAVLDIIHRAGVIIEAVRRSDMQVAQKSGDAGPVTRADREADALLKSKLLTLLPAAWLSEETADDRARLSADRVWIVDPLDGTKEFVAGIPEYAVAVALVEHGQPVLGAVHNPVTAQTVWAVRGEGAYVVSDNRAPADAKRVAVTDGNRLLASRSEIKRGEFEPLRSSWEVVPVGSIEWKLALIAMGQAAATVSRGPKHEWDVCAGALLIQEAGGIATEALGDPLMYNRPRPKVAGILAGSHEAHARLLAQVKQIGVSDRMAELG